MRLLARLLPAAVLLGAAGTACAGGIIRCVAADGAVTYQQVACPEAAREQATNIPNEYPPVNTAERDRIFAREADMYRRLEAERDRLAQQALVRAARADAREVEAPAEPYYVGYPLRPVRPVHHQHVARNQPVWTGGNPLSPGFSR